MLLGGGEDGPPLAEETQPERDATDVDPRDPIEPPPPPQIRRVELKDNGSSKGGQMRKMVSFFMEDIIFSEEPR